MNEFKITLPCRISIGMVKHFDLNLGKYRNANYFTLNKAKINYKEYVYSCLLDKKLINIKADKIIVSYKLIPVSHRRIDTFNFISIVDKFFMDALVEIGIIPDDDYKHVEYKAPIVGSVNKKNDYNVVECTIKLLEEL